MPTLPIKTGHLFIGLAVIMGVATVGMFSGGQHPSQQAAPPEKVETQDVVVPLVAINQGNTLSSSDITTVKWPSAYLPKGSVFSDTSALVGRVAKQDLFPGEPIFSQKVSGGDSKGGLTAMIPPGKRAITISVSEIKGVAGFVKPGDRVDVLTTFDSANEGKSEALKQTQTVLQDVLVLATAQSMINKKPYDIDTPEGVTRGEATSNGAHGNAKSDDTKKDSKKDKKDDKDEAKEASVVSSVTLALDPKDAETLALAEDSGDLRLVLRSEADHAISSLEGTDTEKLKSRSFGGGFHMANFPPPPPVKTPVPSAMLGTQVEFIQGSDKTMYNFNP